MVKILSNNDKELIEQAVAKAENITSADLVTVVAPASDVYQSYLLLYGLMAGSMIDIVLWSTKIVTSFPLLFTIQLLAIILLSFIPFLNQQILRFVPKNILHARAAKRAGEEYLNVSRQVSRDTPIVLLYISIAERYVHIFTSQIVREKISDESWNSIILELTTNVRLEGLPKAIVKATENVTKILIPYFPQKGAAKSLDNSVIEIAR